MCKFNRKKGKDPRNTERKYLFSRIWRALNLFSKSTTSAVQNDAAHNLPESNNVDMITPADSSKGVPPTKTSAGTHKPSTSSTAAPHQQSVPGTENDLITGVGEAHYTATPIGRKVIAGDGSIQASVGHGGRIIITNSTNPREEAMAANAEASRIEQVMLASMRASMRASMQASHDPQAGRRTTHSSFTGNPAPNMQSPGSSQFGAQLKDFINKQKETMLADMVSGMTSGNINIVDGANNCTNYNTYYYQGPGGFEHWDSYHY